MLQLKNIVKDYFVGDSVINALKGVSIDFRKNEFVSILGPSGCGKTTLLNIIGGLDRYTSGDMSINGRSTKEYSDGDWDSYRNHSVGFVFQSYNLIPHQTVLANVELALTLSGVSKSERRSRAEAMLKKVGLGDQLNKKPNQMSGGQMQRVAIARAMVNDPEILLADEPTGALDSETSLQIMELLKDISKDRLVVMVTHNPDIAEKYSTRTIKLLDGVVIDDTDPYTETYAEPPEPEKKRRRRKRQRGDKTSMSYLTALSLSMNNLLTKKGRTFLTAFAGSIGIIGIALILSLSNGFQNYINNVEEDTLSSYPITIEQQSVDLSGILKSVASDKNDSGSHDADKVYVNTMTSDMMNVMATQVKTNNISAFKQYIDDNYGEISDYVTDISYGYGTDLNVYSDNWENGPEQVNPNAFLSSMGYGGGNSMSSAMQSSMQSSMSGGEIWKELMSNEDFLHSQYDVVAGQWPEEYNEVVLIIDKNNEISDYVLYSLGLVDPNSVSDTMTKLEDGSSISIGESSYSYEDILGLTFRVVPNTDYYAYDSSLGVWVDKSGDSGYMEQVLSGATQLKVTGIVRPAENASTSDINGEIGYLPSLTQYLIDKTNDSEIVRRQEEDPDVNVFTGLAFGESASSESGASGLSEEEQSYIASLPEDQQQAYLEQYSGAASAVASSAPADTYDDVLSLLGVADYDDPSSISIYASDFAAKDKIADFISAYNTKCTDDGRDGDVISYTDYVGLLMSSVSTIVNTISYVLIAFVGISLVVSSIMIGIITYISVLERTKEIGILRSIGASKRDVSRVFNAETVIVGLGAGILGIVLTLLLCIPVNSIIKSLTDISGVAALPAAAGAILVAISVLLTLIAGIIPSRIAARKDPVTALRSE